MADNLDFGEDALQRITDPSESLNFPQTLVTEKIIFCIDLLVLTSEYEGQTLITTVSRLLRSYFNLKKKISVRIEFECLLIINSEKISHSCINNQKDFDAVLVSIKNLLNEEEDGPLEIDKVFDEIADLVEFPDPDCCKKSLPPESVYHVVWLISRNLYIPTMTNTNSFDFLMMSPYFALDMLYIYNHSLESSKCEEIGEALSGLNRNGKGYFLSAHVGAQEKLFSCLAQMLGHPLIRPPQLYAKFNIFELGPQFKDIKKDNDEEVKLKSVLE